MPRLCTCGPLCSPLWKLACAPDMRLWLRFFLNFFWLRSIMFLNVDGVFPDIMILPERHSCWRKYIKLDRSPPKSTFSPKIDPFIPNPSISLKLSKFSQSVVPPLDVWNLTPAPPRECAGPDADSNPLLQRPPGPGMCPRPSPRRGVGRVKIPCWNLGPKIQESFSKCSRKISLN